MKPPVETSKEMRRRVVQYVQYAPKWWERLAGWIWAMKKTNTNEWLSRMSVATTYPDELAIHVMSVMANVHTLIVGRDQDVVWTTMDDVNAEFESYDVWLGLVGPLRFRILESAKAW